MFERGFSIITNFGCDRSCEYCIWKMNPRNDMTGASINDLFSILNRKEYRDLTKISISGGGDPLFNFAENRYSFWDNLLHVMKSLRKKIDIHTHMPEVLASFDSVSTVFQGMVNRLVVHVDPESAVGTMEDILSNRKVYDSKLRFGVVITKELTINRMKEMEESIRISEYMKEPVQLAYRELHGCPDLAPQEDVLDFAKGVGDRCESGVFIPNGCYSDYLFPDGEIYKTFLPE